ncbi:MAG: peptidoglycan editing factor PgeF, partial [Candidatus Roizmanbacteria bacterium]|nr:peptidoglycan editing factor PgeF [Candidatus Roizmanbacteria bacterium]
LHQVPIGVVTADCVPVLLADPESGMISAVHAGWRGTVENIVQKAVQSLIGMGSSARSLRAAIGPSIKSCCYDIPPDRTQLFTEKFGTKTIVNTRGTDYIDLQEINYRQLLETGLSYDHIDVIDECTKCNTSYYSYRRGDRDKRMVSYIYRV